MPLGRTQYRITGGLPSDDGPSGTVDGSGRMSHPSAKFTVAAISWPWFVVMLGFQVGSFVCMWWLIRIALPQTDWFVAATSQMAGAAVAKAVAKARIYSSGLGYHDLAVNGALALDRVLDPQFTDYS